MTPTVLTLLPMKQNLKFSAADIAKLIDLLRVSGEYTSADLAGMDKLADLLTCLESLEAEDIEAAVKRYFGLV